MFCRAVLLGLSWVLFFIDHLKVAQITFIELAMSSEGSERSSRYLCFARLIYEVYHEMISHLWFLSKAFLYSPVQLNDALLGASEAAIMIKHIQLISISFDLNTVLRFLACSPKGILKLPR